MRHPICLLAMLVIFSSHANDVYAQERNDVTQPLPLLNGENYVATTKLHKISGIVTDSTGNPIQGADIAIRQSNPNMHETWIVTKAKTDSGGEYSLEVSMTSYPKSEPFIPVGGNSFQISFIDQITSSRFVFDWLLDPESVDETIDFAIPAMTYARINVESEVPKTVLGNVEVYLSSECSELNRDRKSGESRKNFYAIAKSDVHGTAWVPVPLGKLSFGYNAEKAFEGCNQHVSQLTLPEQVQLRPPLDSEAFLISHPFNIMYQFPATDDGVPTPSIQFDANEGAVCEVEIRIPESGVGKRPYGQ